MGLAVRRAPPVAGSGPRVVRGTLLARGHGERVVVSHDICYHTRLTRFGGHGYRHIFSNVVPLMLASGAGVAGTIRAGATST